MRSKNITFSNGQVYVSMPQIDLRLKESELFIIGVVTIINDIYVLVLSESPYNFTGYTVIYDSKNKVLETDEAYLKQKVILTDLNDMYRKGFLSIVKDKYKNMIHVWK